MTTWIGNGAIKEGITRSVCTFGPQVSIVLWFEVKNDWQSCSNSNNRLSNAWEAFMIGASLGFPTVVIPAVDLADWESMPG